MEKQYSLGSLKKMEKTLIVGERSSIISSAGIDDLGDDLLQNILKRLPALSFAWASCVSRSWNSLCNRLLFSSPKLSSALSFNHSLENAVNEVVDKVLSEPIRPHFALVSVGPSFNLQAAHQLILRRLGSGIPIITNVSEGIIGRNTLTDKFVEVQWEVTGEEEGLDPMPFDENVNRGIMLTIGFLPGLKVHTVPLMMEKESRRLFVDDFVMDIREFASDVSDSASPVGIILFADQDTDISSVLQTVEYAFPRDTFVVGDRGSRFLYKSERRNSNSTQLWGSTCAAVSLVFARDKNKPLCVGETQFDVLLSNGISPVGNIYKAVSVRSGSSTWLTASRGSLHEHLDGQALLEEIYDELGDRIQYPAFYIGVTKRRRHTVGMGQVIWMHVHEFHEVEGGDEEFLYVKSGDIKTGEPFRFYISDSKAAISSCNEVSDNLRHLKLDCKKGKVFGGIIFSCCGRGDSFFGQPGIDSAPFLNNFPGVPFGGTYCAGEIGRGNLSLYQKHNEVNAHIHCSQHVYSAVYLVMSYSPPPPQN